MTRVIKTQIGTRVITKGIQGLPGAGGGGGDTGTTEEDIVNLTSTMVYWFDGQDASGWGPSDKSPQIYDADAFNWPHALGHFVRAGTRKQYACRLAITEGIKVPNVPQSLPCTLFVVLDQTGDATGSKTLLQSLDPALTPVVQMKNGRPNVKWNGVDFSHSSTPTGFAVIKIGLTASQISISVNGGPAETQAHAEAGLSSWYSISDPTTNPITADIDAVMIFNETLDSTESGTVTDFLKDRRDIA